MTIKNSRDSKVCLGQVNFLNNSFVRIRWQREVISSTDFTPASSVSGWCMYLFRNPKAWKELSISGILLTWTFSSCLQYRVILGVIITLQLMMMFHVGQYRGVIQINLCFEFLEENHFSWNLEV